MLILASGVLRQQCHPPSGAPTGREDLDGGVSWSQVESPLHEDVGRCSAEGRAASAKIDGISASLSCENKAITGSKVSGGRSE